MKLSVIIPTYNRGDVLSRAIEAIYNQTMNRRDYEVLVINDGSTDQTGEVVKKLRQNYPFHYHYQKNSGPAVARNWGIKKAKGSIVILTQDDIIATPSFLAQHLSFHENFPQENIAVVGYTTWHPELGITPFMRWLEHGGPQFDYDRLRGRLEVDFLAFYTSNLSLKRDFVLQNGLLDEDFYVPGSTAYEDTEWGWRLSKKGLRILHNPEAKAYHFHSRDLKSVCQRRIHEGRIFHLLIKKHPEFRWKVKGESWWHRLAHLKTDFLPEHFRVILSRILLKSFLIFPLEKLASFLQDKIYSPVLFKIVCGYYYGLGYAESINSVIIKE